MVILDKIIWWLSRGMIVLGGVFLVGMVVLTSADIILRLFGTPVPGTVELMGFFGAVATALALGYTQIRRGHIAVDVLIHTFSKRTQYLLNRLNNVVCLVFFGLAAWQIARKAGTVWRTGEITETLRIVYHPFIYAVAFGCVVLCLVFVADLIRSPRPKKEDRT